MDLTQVIIVFMTLCLICLIWSMIYFIRDVAVSLQALKVELQSD